MDNKKNKSGAGPGKKASAVNGAKASNKFNKQAAIKNSGKNNAQVNKKINKKAGKTENTDASDKNTEKSSINWYPGHMTKAVRMMKENISLVDIIVEITDARIPSSSRNPDIDELGKDKFRLVILNKADLADKSITDKWIEYYKSKGIYAIELDSRNFKGMKDVKNLMTLACKEKIDRDRARGIIGRPIRAMVAGIPNVGKSTFINHLTGKNAAKTGNKPGVTKGKQWIMLGQEIQLLDTPGILWPKFEDQRVGNHLAMTGSINDNILDIGELCIGLLKDLEKNYAANIYKTYNINDEDIDRAIEEDHLMAREAGIIAAVAARRNLLLPGSKYDYARASDLIIDDFRSGRLGRISLEEPMHDDGL
ncbi:ribosome biogenesis GTPase YlqF [Butyrivibrio sp. MC2013]|uniref:ribosome biogenesis GTPase YlqF n=1 Tax=Butyrivibrio sp. MC2013 TaxID=1280686 RepID=UPI0009DB722F|nr:ribosome biogenesis GTPase YlqF [Butyrivibrio sp. MC2013]